MHCYRLIFIPLLCMLFFSSFSQTEKGSLFTGVVFDEKMSPIPYTHVIAHGSGQGDMTDKMGVFHIYVLNNDLLSFYNIAFQDSTVRINKNVSSFYIKLKHKVYSLSETKVFTWGSTYEEMLDEVKRQGVPELPGDKMNLPRQDPNAIPFNLDEKKIESVGFLLASPLSYIYYNKSKYEKSLRKAHQLEIHKGEIRRYEELMSPTNISDITGLKETELDKFLIYMNARFQCTYKCSEIDILSEIYKVWKYYEEIM